MRTFDREFNEFPTQMAYESIRGFCISSCAFQSPHAICFTFILIPYETKYISKSMIDQSFALDGHTDKYANFNVNSEH